eukprot:gene4445-6287_t
MSVELLNYCIDDFISDLLSFNEDDRDPRETAAREAAAAALLSQTSLKQSDDREKQQTQVYVSDSDREIAWLQSIMTSGLGATTFVIGAKLSKVAILDEVVEMTHIIPKKQCEDWCCVANKALCEEGCKISNKAVKSPSPEVGSAFIQSISVNLVRLDVEAHLYAHSYRISPNNISNLLMVAVIEEVDLNLVGKDHLFKKSLILIKAWCNLESRKYSFIPLGELFDHQALCVITLWLFSSRMDSDMPIEHPLDALVYFLDDISKIDWSVDSVTASKLLKLPDAAPINFLGLSSGFRVNQGQPNKDRQDNQNQITMFGRHVENIINKYRQLYDMVARDDPNPSPKSSMNPFGENSGKWSILDIAALNDAKDAITLHFTVLDPFSQRNLCDSPTKTKLKVGTTISVNDIMQRVKIGAEECSAFLAQLYSVMTRQNTFINETASIHPLTNDELVATMEKYFTMSYQFIRARTPTKAGFARSLHESIARKGSYKEAKIKFDFGNRLTSSPILINRYVQHVDTMLSKKLRAETLLNLTLQVLNRLGPTPIGEIGKQMQIITGNQDLLKEVKKSFLGLKRFISLYPHVFRVGEDHAYNPKVFIIGQHDTLS